MGDFNLIKNKLNCLCILYVLSQMPLTYSFLHAEATPDCIEMPYKPVVRDAYQEPVSGKPTYRLGGNSCLSGDYLGDWSFDEKLKPGDKIVFEDMIHYTIVKTTMFNGIPHPDLCLLRENGELETFRHFEYEDYKNRMS